MEMSAGVPLISMRPFAAAKWSAWLVSKESPLFSGSLLVILNPLHILPHPLPSSLYRGHTKNTRVTKTLFFQYCKKTKQTCRNACTWSSGECNWWPVSRHEPLDTTADNNIAHTHCMMGYRSLQNTLVISNINNNDNI